MGGDGQDVELVVDDDAHLAGGKGEDKPGGGYESNFMTTWPSEFKNRSLISG